MSVEVFPLALQVMSDYLSDRDELTGVEVLPRIPATRPNRFIVLSTAPAFSAPTQRVLSTRRLIAGCWDTTLLNAGLLAETVRSLIYNSKYAGIGVRKVTFPGEPAEFPHPDIKDRFRWQLTSDLLMRANII